MDRSTVELMRTPWPADWVAIFGRPAPLVIEIGFGNGQFLLALAQQRPEINIVGLEIARPSMRRTEARLTEASLTNVRLIRAKAQSVLMALFQPAAVQGVIINFPDPWPKEGHAHRRLISDAFLRLLANRLAPGADLDIATDHAQYGAWIAQRLQESPHFESRHDSAYLTEDPNRQRTKYERKGLAAGSTCYYFQWRRNSVPAATDLPELQELPMPHVVITIPLTLDEIAERFESRECPAEGASIRLIDLYRSLTRPALVVDTYVVEQPLEQRLMLEIYRRSDSDMVIRLMATGFPRSTAGVHAAIECLARWLTGLHPAGAIVRHNLRQSSELP